MLAQHRACLKQLGVDLQRCDAEWESRVWSHIARSKTDDEAVIGAFGKLYDLYTIANPSKSTAMNSTFTTTMQQA